MKIGLVSSIVPHTIGGYRFIVDWLEPHLERHGYRVERIYLPQTGKGPLHDAIATRMLDLSHSCDRIITFRPPAHMLRHPSKVAWFIHHERAFYDLWRTNYCPVPATKYWTSYRNALHTADTTALSEARLLFTNSEVVKERVRRFNGLESEVLYPPLAQAEHFQRQHVGDEIVCICRIEHHKRQWLMLEAMCHTKSPVRLRLAGRSSDEAHLSFLTEFVLRHGLRDRVTIDPRWISEGEKRFLLSICLASAYLPVDEDSYGYPTLEASHAEKATVTATDAGGTLEFIMEGQSGLVVEPDAQALADAFDRLWLDRGLAERLGRGARARIDSLDISWDRVVERLTA